MKTTKIKRKKFYYVLNISIVCIFICSIFGLYIGLKTSRKRAEMMKTSNPFEGISKGDIDQFIKNSKKNKINTENINIKSTVSEDIPATNFVGSWINDFQPKLTHTIYIELIGDHSARVRREFPDGSFDSRILKRQGQKIFFDASPSGDYYLLNNDRLSIWDDEGFIKELRNLN